jgi:hypothetical protein
MERKETLRVISLEDNFMKNKNINDAIYGYYQSISYLDKDNRRFVYKQHINYTDMENNLGFTRKTIRSNTKVLIDTGFLEEGTTKDNYGKEVECYYLPYKHNYFRCIPNTTLKYLLTVKGKDVIKVYVYLLDKFLWKAKQGEKYIFTGKELLLAIGYSEKTITKGSKGKKSSFDPYEKIRYILNSLSNEGLIKFEKVYYKGINHTIPNMKLIQVNTVVKGMEKETQKADGEAMDITQYQF